MKNLIVFIIFVLSLQSCENNMNKVNEKKAITTNNVKINSNIEIQNQSVENENNLQEPEIIFPKTGNKAADFLPSLNVYEIQYEAKRGLKQRWFR